LGIDVLDPDGNAPISRSDLQKQTRETLADIRRAKAFIAAYKESRTTDNVFLQRQLRHSPKNTPGFINGGLKVPSSIHLHSPSLSAFDSRGLPVRQVAYLRTVPDGPVQAFITRVRHDAAGHPLEQFDARLTAPNLMNVFGLSVRPLKVDSVDAGPSLVLPGPAGEEQQRWDAMGNHWRTLFDRRLRPISIEEIRYPTSKP